MSNTNRKGTPTIDVTIPTGSMEPSVKSLEIEEAASITSIPNIVDTGIR